MPIAATTSIEPLHRPTMRPSVVSITRRKRRMPPPPERMWARYKPAPWWTAVAAFAVSVAIHIGAVAVLETSADGRLTRLCEDRVLAGEELGDDERGNN
jgi:hypothetical protein